MSSIKIMYFGGEVPVRAAHLLAEKHAAQAQNVRLSGGSARAWAKPYAVYTPVKANVASMFRMAATAIGDVWLTWTEDVNAVPGPIANDTDHKVYYTGQATPRKTNYSLATNAGAATDFPFDYLELGVPAPTAAPGLTVVGGSGSTTTRSYVYTFVTAWGEESKPSAAVTVTGFINGTWALTGLQTSIAGKYSLSQQNIYRTLTDAFGTTNYQLVATQSLATTYNDTTADANLGLLLGSTTYDVPPSDLTMIITCPNGVMAGFSPSTKQLCFCEPFKPWAWPQAYRYAVEYVIVGIAANGNAVIVATQGAPYLFTGSHPSTMSSQKLATIEPCASKRSVIDAGWGVMYAGNNGFVVASPSGVDKDSEALFSRVEWSKLNPTSMRFAKYDGRIYIFYKTADAVPVYGGYILDRETGDVASLNQICDGLFMDTINGFVYLLQNNVIKQWNGDPFDVLNFTWRSGRYIMPRPVNFGVAQVDADYASISNATNQNNLLARQKTDNQAVAAANLNIRGGWNSWQFNGANAFGEGVTFDGSMMHDLFNNPVAQFVTFKLYVEGVLKFTKAISTRSPFRLPSGYKSDDYTVEIDGSVDVRYVKIAETFEELKKL